MKSAALSIDALQAAVDRLPDDKLTPTRRAALEHFRTRGMPTTRDEDWKYTDLARVIDISNQSLLDDSDQSAAIDLSATINEIRESIDADWLVIANGVIDSESVAAISADQYRISLLSESEDRLDFEAPLADLNATLLRDGLRIDIDANAAPARPIGILVIDDATTSPAMAQARVSIELKSDSTASFVEYHASTGKGEHYANSLVDLVLGDNSRARYVRIQGRDANHYQTSRTSVRVGPDSEFNYCAFDLGGALIRNDIDVDISAPGANAELNGLFLAGGRQHIDNHTRVDHRVGPATSATAAA